MISIHYEGILYEFLPNTGEVSWVVKPWGYWRISSKSEKYEAVVEAVCDTPGTVLRAPTANGGLSLNYC